MKLSQIKQIKSALEKFFYKIGLNVGLYGVMSKKKYESFRKQMINALSKQILSFATIEKIRQITGDTAKVDGDLILSRIKKNWLPLMAILEEQTLIDYYFWVANEGGKIALDKIGVDKKFVLENKALSKQLSARANEMTKQVDSTTQKWIADIASKGLNQGASAEDIAHSILENGRDVAEHRGEKVTEYETAMTLSEVENEVYQRNGVAKVKWVTARDERVDPICITNGQHDDITLGDLFPDGSKAPPAHIGCRCILVPVSVELPESIWTGE